MSGPSAKRILVVDDDPGFLRWVTAALEAHGYQVVTAADGREGLARLREEPETSMILLDLLMPGIDGWKFREAQMQEPALASIPTVVITAISHDYLKAGYLPGVLVLPKPFDVPQLLAFVAEQCG